MGEVDTDALVPQVLVDLVRAVAGVVGGVVDEHRHRAEGIGHLADHPLEDGEVADVGMPVDGPGRAGGGDGLHQGLAGVVQDVHEPHPGALSGKLGHELGPQARGAPTDQHHPAPQAGVGGERSGGRTSLGAQLSPRPYPGTTTERPTVPLFSSSYAFCTSSRA